MPTSRCSANAPHSRSMNACTTWNAPATTSSAPMKMTPAMVKAMTSNQATTPSTSWAIPRATNHPQRVRGRRRPPVAVRSLMARTLTKNVPPGQPGPGRALVSPRRGAYASVHDRRPFLAMTVAVAAEARHRPAPTFGVVLAVLGVVYGDIGTSPLYAFKASLQHFQPGDVTNLEIMGILSLIFWSLVLVVTVKYVLLILLADNRGEGGILALMALAQRVSVGSRVRSTLTLIGIVGACLFFGDGVITPAISVLSAVEGLEVSAPELKHYVLPISVVVILLLFAAQSRGTGSCRPRVRSDHGGVVPVDRPARHMGDRAASVRSAGAVAQLRGDALPASRIAGLHRAGLGRALRDRRRGAVRRHGTLRSGSDPRRLAVLRAALPGAELFRPGRAADRRA